MENTANIIKSALSPQENERVFRYLVAEAMEQAKTIEPSFVIDDSMKSTFRALCLYFSNDPRFEDEDGRKLGKGILLAGNIGTGKTLLMNIFHRNPFNPFSIASATRMANLCMIGGVEELDSYCGISQYGVDARPICFDDLGAENSLVKWMGNEINAMETIILSRYDRRIPFRNTHFTTNIDGPEIEKRYGTRVKSRLREMVNFIVLDGGDRRK